MNDFISGIVCGLTLFVPAAIVILIQSGAL